ncbi:MAG: ABC transporter permease [Muribaculaceae bacterium]|nr:ABC transporter permease [Muribaculaceae bacterium]
MNLSLNIALRYLRAKKGHTAVNIISIISVLGVVVTTAALICVLSVFNGFHDLIKDKLSNVDPDIAITATMGKTISDADSVMKVASAIPGVAKVMPVVEDNALAIFADFSMPLRLKGVPKNYNELTGIDSVVVEGDFLLDDGVSRYAVMGVGPAVNLNARPGSLRMLQLYAPQRRGQVDLNDPMNAFTEDSVFVSGVFMVQQKNYDNDMVFVPIDLARELFDYTTEASQVEVKLAPGTSEADVMEQLEAQLGASYTVKNRIMQQDASFRLVNMEKWITFLLLAFILVIATFNVISTLSLLIIEKDESIRTFRSLGATDKQITRIFVTEGWLIALVGAVIGVAVGLVLCLCQQQFGWLKLSASADAVIVQSYPVSVVWTDVVVVFMLVAAVGLVTSFVTSLMMRHRLNK